MSQKLTIFWFNMKFNKDIKFNICLTYFNILLMRTFSLLKIKVKKTKKILYQFLNIKSKLLTSRKYKNKTLFNKLKNYCT